MTAWRYKEQQGGINEKAMAKRNVSGRGEILWQRRVLQHVSAKGSLMKMTFCRKEIFFFLWQHRRLWQGEFFFMATKKISATTTVLPYHVFYSTHASTIFRHNYGRIVSRAHLLFSPKLWKVVPYSHIVTVTHNEGKFCK